jgi:hypothetical protein
MKSTWITWLLVLVAILLLVVLNRLDLLLVIGPVSLFVSWLYGRREQNRPA